MACLRLRDELLVKNLVKRFGVCRGTITHMQKQMRRIAQNAQKKVAHAAEHRVSE